MLAHYSEASTVCAWAYKLMLAPLAGRVLAILLFLVLSHWLGASMARTRDGPGPAAKGGGPGPGPARSEPGPGAAPAPPRRVSAYGGPGLEVAYGRGWTGPRGGVRQRVDNASRRPTAEGGQGIEEAYGRGRTGQK